jgi:hypothetical protein
MKLARNWQQLIGRELTAKITTEPNKGKESKMKISAIIISIVLGVSMVLGGCQTTEDANEKLEECIADEYGEESVDTKMAALEIDCEDGEKECDECVDCILDKDCDDVLGGECADLCE